MTDTATAPSVGPRGPLRSSGLLVRAVLARVLVDPVRAGRLRDRGWPAGLRAVVTVAVVAYVVAGIVVVLSGLLRDGSMLTVPSPATVTVPRAWLWLVLLVVLVAVALFQTAALHAAWWLRVVALGTSAVVMGQWGLRDLDPGGGLVESALSVLAIVGLIVFAILRWRRAFAWWEFVVVWVLITAPVVLGIVVLNRTAGPLGFDFVPTYVLGTMTLLGPVAIPAAVAAGLSVAEITVSATLWTTRLGGRVASRRTAYLVLAVLLAARLIQAGWQIATAGGDLSVEVVAPWLLLGAVVAALWLIMMLVAGRRTGSPEPPSDSADAGHLRLSELPERMAALALPLGAAYVAGPYLMIVVVAVFSIAGQLAPAAIGATSGAWQDYIASSLGPALIRVLLGLGLVAVAVRRARRGHLADALLLSAVAALLWARSVRPLSGGAVTSGTDFDALNLLVTAALVVVIAVLVIRRRLTGRRAICLSAAVVVTFLLGYRDFVSDPLGSVLGFSGAALVLFGLTWDLLTGSAVGNNGSRKYPTPARVLLILANGLLAMGILAFTSLVRNPGATIDLGAFAELGNEILGTALMATAFLAILLAVRDDRVVD